MCCTCDRTYFRGWNGNKLIISRNKIRKDGLKDEHNGDQEAGACRRTGAIKIEGQRLVPKRRELLGMEKHKRDPSPGWRKAEEEESFDVANVSACWKAIENAISVLGRQKRSWTKYYNLARTARVHGSSRKKLSKASSFSRNWRQTYMGKKCLRLRLETIDRLKFVKSSCGGTLNWE